MCEHHHHPYHHLGALVVVDVNVLLLRHGDEVLVVQGLHVPDRFSQLHLRKNNRRAEKKTHESWKKKKKNDWRQDEP